jgi:hypothetical protein
MQDRQHRRPWAARPGWLWLSLAALGFSLFHVLIDFLIGIYGPSSPTSVLQGVLMLLVSLVYVWWGLALVMAASGARAGFVSLVVLALGWAFVANGASIVVCPPPCPGAAPFGDVAHVGCLLFGGSAAYAAWRALRVRAPG